MSPSFAVKTFLILGIMLNIPGRCQAEPAFSGHHPQGEISMVYNVQVEEASHRRYITRIKKRVEGKDIIITHRQDETGETIEAVSAFKDFRPIYTARLDKDDLIYKISFDDEYADVLIPTGSAEKSQSAIPRIFKRLLGVGNEENKDIAERMFSQKELAEIKNKEGIIVPSDRILKRMAEYKRKNKMLPSKNEETIRRIKLPKDLYILQDVSLAFENFPFKSEKKVSFHLSYLPHPMVIWKMVLKKVSEEEVTVPAGRFLCHKLKMETSEWWSFLAFGLDDYFIWVMKDYPQIYVKSTFPFAGWQRELVSFTIR